MTSSSYFFRVEHDLLRSEAFKTLGGSAIKVYLVIGLYSDFGTDWAYPSIRTIATQAGLSRQTVIAAIQQLTAARYSGDQQSEGPLNSLPNHPPSPQPARSATSNPQSPQRIGWDWSIFFRGYALKWSRFFRWDMARWSRF